jgi:glutamyl-tRNA reductase
VCLYLHRPPTEDEYEDRRSRVQKMEGTSLIPLDEFLRCFGDPAQMARELEKEGRALIEEYMAENSSASRRRQAVDCIIDLWTQKRQRFQRMTQRTRKEVTVGRLMLSTYGWNNTQLNKRRLDKMTLSSIKVPGMMIRSFGPS